MIIKPQFRHHSFTVPRGTSAVDIIAEIRRIEIGIKDFHTPSDRCFGDAEGACAQIELGAEEILAPKEIECEAIRQGWNVADPREFAAFTLKVPWEGPNCMPEFLLGAWNLQLVPSVVATVWVLKRKGWGQKAQFSLASVPIEELPQKQLHILFVREYPQD